MNALSLEQLKRQKVEAREELFQKAVAVLKKLDPVAIHQFGSGADGYKDELSDIDLFTTVPDEHLNDLVANGNKIYQQIAPILLYNTVLHQEEDGAAYYYHDLILFEHENGIVHFENSFAPSSIGRIPEHAKHIWGDDSLSREPNAIIAHAVYHDRSLDRHLNGLLAMIYVAIKGMVRGWEWSFFEWVQGIYDSYLNESGLVTDPLPKEKGFSFLLTMLDNLKDEGDKRQQKANRKIYAFAKQVAKLYSSKTQ